MKQIIIYSIYFSLILTGYIKYKPIQNINIYLLWLYLLNSI